jgi:hypothetical protein
VRLAAALLSLAGLAVLPGEGWCADAEYVVATTTAEAPALLGDAPEAWKDARRVSFGPAAYTTEFAALWAADALYLRFAATDDKPWHTKTRRDDHLWEEEVVEIFLDPARRGRDYAEIEISPANVVCDVLLVTPSPNKKYDVSWNLPGLETKVLPWKDAAGRAVGWIALARVPFTGLRALPASDKVALPPRAGDRWRFNLFRVERPGGPAAPEKGAIEVAWSPTGEPSFHVPAAFRDFVFGPAPAAAR